MNRRGFSLSTRLTILLSLVTSVLFISFWAISYEIVSQRLQTQDFHLMKDRLRTVQSLLGNEKANPEALKKRVESEWAAREFDRVFVRIKNQDGTTLTGTPTLDGRDIFDGLQIGDIGSGRMTRFGVGDRVMVGAKLNVRNYVIDIAFDRTSEADLLRTLREVLLILTLTGIAICVACAKVFASKALKPVGEISSAAARINSTSLKGRIDPDLLPIEFHELAATLNHMLTGLEDSFDRLSRFSADMAHELRTPVNNLLGSFEVALSQPRTARGYVSTLESGVEECERLKRIIESLLFIARSNNPQREINLQEIDLSAELKEIVGFYEASAEDAGIAIELAVRAPQTILAEKILLQRAVGNLLSNSIRHSQSGSKICVEAACENNRAIIKVIDEGSGIDEAVIPRIGERFFRADPSRSTSSGGTGLGLSIVKVIATIHGGDLKITSRLRHGTTVQLDFPLARHA